MRFVLSCAQVVIENKHGTHCPCGLDLWTVFSIDLIRKPAIWLVNSWNRFNSFACRVRISYPPGLLHWHRGIRTRMSYIGSSTRNLSFRANNKRLTVVRMEGQSRYQQVPQTQSLFFLITLFDPSAKLGSKIFKCRKCDESEWLYMFCSGWLEEKLYLWTLLINITPFELMGK